jgi:hypothetical protein
MIIDNFSFLANYRELLFYEMDRKELVHREQIK